MAEDRPKVLILLAQGFNRGEFWHPYTVLTLSGIPVAVAGGNGKQIPRDKEGVKSDPWDVIPDLSINEVNPDEYDALLIPGGYSPSFLEKDPKALEICKSFDSAGKPIAAICHGPRLLMKADLLKDKVSTSWFQVASELPQDWKDRAQGKHVRQATVQDENILTARFPGDNRPFTEAFLEQLNEPIVPEQKTLKVDFDQPPFKALKPIYSDNPKKLASHLKSVGWEFSEEDSGPTVKWIGFKEETAQPLPVATIQLQEGFDDVAFTLAKSHLESRGFDVEIASNELGWKSGKNGIPAKATKQDNGIEGTFSLADPKEHRETIAWVNKIKQGVTEPYDKEKPVDVVIALREGYDGPSAIALKGWLLSQGKNVATMAHQTGPQSSLNGFSLNAELTYDDTVSWSDTPLVVAPGSHWPEAPEEGQEWRGGEAVEWIESQRAADNKRVEWILAQMDSGSEVIAIGFDSYLLGRQPRFKGLRFAAPDQNVWSLSKKRGAGLYLRGANASRTHPQLVTAKGGNDIPEALALLQQNDKN